MPTKHKGTEEERQALDLTITLARATQALGNKVSCEIVAAGLSHSQFGVLDVLYHLGPLTLGDIAKKHLKSPNNMTSVVDTMERSGLVERRRCDKDRRVIYVDITKKGRDIFAKIWPGHVERLVRAVSTLTADEQAELARLCKKLGQAECNED
ncbi:MAG: MarR family transcriptional regulator, and catechol-resistance regulon repressor [Fimbriimonadaceae bacterium]|jgi:MarR family 2-MHQ and catechol resistance regulon transcriptional repressor|nr:MarR family transcriptional regulator, and catechol-resistance regulon repressor [Fimbriimonadaceae bacterium]